MSSKNNEMEPATGWTAKRFTQKPLRQPTYDFRDVPKCSRDLTGSSLHFLTEREHLVEAMSEMVLLCIEAIRRNQKSGGKKRSSKPLSLEYMADRLDVDDPICGYLIRTKEKPTVADVALNKWEMGMLQGFITVTTFTNWQKSFRWDSMHDSAFAYDDEQLAEQMASGERRYDEDGSLAKALQATVRSGDPWEEGIVWPRIAEISLLGGLGCGMVLVSLAIEHLEHLKATGKANYDYVVLQATDNSIPFYESMGFVRVGAITEDDKFNEKQSVQVCETSSHSSDTGDDPVAEPLDESTSSEDPDSPPVTPEIVSTPIVSYTTEKPGECIKDIARRFHADPWDTVFMNHEIHDGLTPSSRIIKGTVLRIPCPSAESIEEAAAAARNDDEAPKWYIARENDTPRIIAKKFNVNCRELVEANKGRLPELLAVSRLKEGTRIKVSHFHIHDDMHVPYCHWTFPDDDFDSGEPSYMMVRKLNRQSGRQRPVESSLAVPISPYAPARLLMPETIMAQRKQAVVAGKDSVKTPKPKRPPSAFMLFVAKQRAMQREDLRKMRLSDVSQKLSAEWKLLADSEKQVFYDEFQKARVKYIEAKEKYAKHMAETAASYPDPAEATDGGDSQDLFNKVVRLKPGALRDVSEYTYWYVLTYIPDLKWCHLGPLYSNGTFGPDKPKSEGRTKYRLVDEKLGKELDISASFCMPVKSKALKKTQDADKEEWDIIDPVRRSGSFNVASRSSPRRKSELPDTLCERRPSESVPKSLTEEILGTVPPPPMNLSKNPAAMTKPPQLKKAVFSTKRVSRGGVQNAESVQQSREKKLIKLADLTASEPKSLLLRLTMSSNDPTKKSSETFLEEPLVAFCAGMGITQDAAVTAKQLSPHKSPSKTARIAESEEGKQADHVTKACSPRAPDSNVESTESSVSRPKRKVAPHFLGESPSSVETTFRMQTPRARAAIKPLGGMVKKKTKRQLDATAVHLHSETSNEHLNAERPKRKAAPESIDDQHPRKRLNVKSAGSRRSV